MNNFLSIFNLSGKWGTYTPTIGPINFNSGGATMFVTIQVTNLVRGATNGFRIYGLNVTPALAVATPGALASNIRFTNIQSISLSAKKWKDARAALINNRYFNGQAH